MGVRAIRFAGAHYISRQGSVSDKQNKLLCFFTVTPNLRTSGNTGEVNKIGVFCHPALS